jgi:hypothetical protein
MKTNIGSYDEAVRFVGGCLIALWGVHVESWWGLLGLIPVLTAAVRCCPLYIPLHIDTRHFDD